MSTNSVTSSGALRTLLGIIALAVLLNLSVKTVETHRAQLMERLDIHDVAGLVKYAMHIGLIPPVD